MQCVAQVMSAPTTPQHVAPDPPSTPPRLPRELSSFLQPDVKFFGLLSGEAIEIEERTIMAAKCTLAAKNDIFPQCVEFYDASHQKIPENQHCCADKVFVHFDGEAVESLLLAFAMDVAH